MPKKVARRYQEEREKTERAKRQERDREREGEGDVRCSRNSRANNARYRGVTSAGASEGDRRSVRHSMSWEEHRERDRTHTAGERGGGNMRSNTARERQVGDEWRSSDELMRLYGDTHRHSVDRTTHI